MEDEDQAADAVENGTVEAELRTLPQIAPQFSAITADSIDTILDSVQRPQEHRGAVILLRV